MESMRTRRSGAWPVVAVLSLIALFVAPASGCSDDTTDSDSDSTTSTSTAGSSTGGSTSTASSSGGGGEGGEGSSTSTSTASGGGGEGGGGSTSTSSSSGGGGEGGSSSTSSSSGGAGGEGGAGGSTSSSTGGGGGGCGIDEVDCNGTCVADDDPAYGCGSCTPCNLPNAVESCSAGQCVVDSCVGDYDNCDGSDANGCEINLDTDNNNCGVCDNVCLVSEGNGSVCNGSGSCTPAILDFSCTGWSRDAAFDAMKIDGNDIQLVGGMTGTSGSNLYVTIATYSKGAIGRWNGSTWTVESLPSSPSVPTKVNGLWAVDANTIYATGADVNASRLFVRTGGVWSNAVNAPSTIEMVDVTGTDANNVWILGQDPGEGKIWKKSGATWTAQSLPSLPFPHRLIRIWALDANNVFATGYHYDISTGDHLEGLLVRWNGSTWSKVTSVPSTSIQIGAIHGTSMNDLFVTGQKSNGNGVIYHVTNNVATWDEYSDPSVDFYYPVWSKHTGAVLAGGVVPPGSAGFMRTTVDSMMSSPTTSTVDGLATDAVQFWPEPGTDKVHFVHISAPGVIAGHYSSTCN